MGYLYAIIFGTIGGVLIGIVGTWLYFSCWFEAAEDDFYEEFHVSDGGWK